jgi:hypothetical protein
MIKVFFIISSKTDSSAAEQLDKRILRGDPVEQKINYRQSGAKVNTQE